MWLEGGKPRPLGQWIQEFRDLTPLRPFLVEWDELCDESVSRGRWQGVDSVLYAFNTVSFLSSLTLGLELEGAPEKMWGVDRLVWELGYVRHRGWRMPVRMAVYEDDEDEAKLGLTHLVQEAPERFVLIVPSLKSLPLPFREMADDKHVRILEISHAVRLTSDGSICCDPLVNLLDKKVQESERILNRFVLTADKRHWQVSFLQEKGLVDNRLGFRYLRHLLEAPGRAISVLALEMNEGRVDARGHIGEDFSEDHARAQELSFGALGAPKCDEMSDREAMRAVRKELASLRRRQAEAQAKGEEQSPEVQHQIGKIEQYLLEIRYRSGAQPKKGPKVFPDSNAEKARKAVRKAIKDAVESLPPTLKGFRQHLDTALEYGSRITYKMEHAQEWAFDPTDESD